jgi:hypothetical protein
MSTPNCRGDPAGQPSRPPRRRSRTFAPVFAPQARRMLDTLVRQALGGHPPSLRACERWGIAVGRGRPLPITLAPIENAADARAAVAQITAELRAGRLTVRETARLLRAVEPFHPGSQAIALVKQMARIEADLAEAAAAIGHDYFFTISEGPAAARARMAAHGDRARPRPARPFPRLTKRFDIDTIW